MYYERALKKAKVFRHPDPGISTDSIQSRGKDGNGNQIINTHHTDWAKKKKFLMTHTVSNKDQSVLSSTHPKFKGVVKESSTSYVNTKGDEETENRKNKRHPRPSKPAGIPTSKIAESVEDEFIDWLLGKEEVNEDNSQMKSFVDNQKRQRDQFKIKQFKDRMNKKLSLLTTNKGKQ